MTAPKPPPDDASVLVDALIDAARFPSAGTHVASPPSANVYRDNLDAARSALLAFIAELDGGGHA